MWELRQREVFAILPGHPVAILAAYQPDIPNLIQPTSLPTLFVTQYPLNDFHLYLVVRFDEYQSESKNKRKRVVDQVNKWLDKNDTLLTKIEEVFEKFQK